MQEDEDAQLQAALALSLGVQDVPAADPLALPATVAISSTGPPAQSVEARIMEICGCTHDAARGAVLAAGRGGISMAVELLMSGDVDLPTRSRDPRRTKLVCLVREDLGMGVGKVAAQVAHGALGAHREASRGQPDMLREWGDGGEATIVLSVRGDAEARTQHCHPPLPRSPATPLPRMSRSLLILRPSHAVADAAQLEQLA